MGKSADISGFPIYRAISGLKFLEGLAEEDWASVSSREAQVLKRLMTQCTMPTWVRAVLDGLLTVLSQKQITEIFKVINKELDKLGENCCEPSQSVQKKFHRSHRC